MTHKERLLQLEKRLQTLYRNGSSACIIAHVKGQVAEMRRICAEVDAVEKERYSGKLNWAPEGAWESWIESIKAEKRWKEKRDKRSEGTHTGSGTSD